MRTSIGFVENDFRTGTDFYSLDDGQLPADRGVPLRSRPYYNDRTGTDFYSVDDRQPSPNRGAPLRSRPYNQENQHQEAENGVANRTSKSERSICCSKPCLIGLFIGLAIGIALVISIAVPIGVVGFSKMSAATSTAATATTTTISTTPNWVGIFQMDNGCDTSQCCCLTNQITLSAATSNQLLITGSTTGQCPGSSSASFPIQPIPTGFQTTFGLSGEIVRLQLGKDSSYISFVNFVQGACSTTGLRIPNNTVIISTSGINTARMKSMNMGLVMCILSIIMGIMI